MSVGTTPKIVIGPPGLGNTLQYQSAVLNGLDHIERRSQAHTDHRPNQTENATHKSENEGDNSPEHRRVLIVVRHHGDTGRHRTNNQ